MLLKKNYILMSRKKRKLELLCEFSKKFTIMDGNIRKIDKTNLNYIETNRIIIKNKNEKYRYSSI